MTGSATVRMLSGTAFQVGGVWGGIQKFRWREKIKHLSKYWGVVNTGRPLQVKYWGLATLCIRAVFYSVAGLGWSTSAYKRSRRSASHSTTSWAIFFRACHKSSTRSHTTAPRLTAPKSSRPRNRSVFSPTDFTSVEKFRCSVLKVDLSSFTKRLQFSVAHSTPLCILFTRFIVLGPSFRRQKG